MTVKGSVSVGRPRREEIGTLRSLVRGFLNFHRDIAGARQASRTEAERALRFWRRTSDRRFFAIRVDADTVGFLVLRKDPQDCVFWGEELYVTPLFRQRGIAREAMRFAERYVSRHGGDALYLWVATTNARMLQIARHMGYRRLNMVEVSKDLPSTRPGARRKTRARSPKLKIGGTEFDLPRAASTEL
jgi:GNAT superfamily N-acetyltransferase